MASVRLGSGTSAHPAGRPAFRLNGFRHRQKGSAISRRGAKRPLQRRRMSILWKSGRAADITALTRFRPLAVLSARRKAILQIQDSRCRFELAPFAIGTELTHDMQQAVVCRRLLAICSASVVESWTARGARRRSCLSCLRGRSDRQTEMHKRLPCTLSRLSSSEPGAIVPVSGCLPGLHPIHLHWYGTGMIDVPFAAVLPIASEGHPLAI